MLIPGNRTPFFFFHSNTIIPHKRDSSSLNLGYHSGDMYQIQKSCWDIDSLSYRLDNDSIQDDPLRGESGSRIVLRVKSCSHINISNPVRLPNFHGSVSQDRLLGLVGMNEGKVIFLRPQRRCLATEREREREGERER